jgi:CheY-like chemotaxis protein
MSTWENRRVLLVDDMPAIHDDYRKILVGDATAADLNEDEMALFGASARTAAVDFELESAYQGVEAADKVRASLLADRPYAMAFVDMRMPPGWDGVETIEHLWQEDPRAADRDLHRLFGLLLEGSIKPARRARSPAYSQETLRRHRGLSVRQRADLKMGDDKTGSVQNE